MTQEAKRKADRIEQILLAKKNCHRASKVISTENPEQGEWLFNWRGKKLSENRSKPIFTNRHKFWKLSELANQSIVRQSERENQEDVEILFDGGRVIKNYSEDRVQIVFDTKPQPDVISNLKHNGFRWSPRFSAWQRQLTNNAYYAVTRVIPVTIEQLKVK